MNRHIFSFLPAVSILIVGVMHLCVPSDGQMPEVLERCGFPGLPVYGNITPYKDTYGKREQITYICDKGANLVGPENNTCKDSTDWTVGKPPLCKINYAYGGNTLFSKETDKNFASPKAVDGDHNTCTSITTDAKKRWWGVDLRKRINVTEIFILVNAANSMYNFSVLLYDQSHPSRAWTIKECGRIVDRDTRPLKVNLECTGTASRITIEDHRIISNGILQLCEVEVFSTPETICGEPDRQPNCLVRTISTVPYQTIEYKPQEGYRMNKGDIRICKDGSWLGSTPTCFPNPGYISADSTNNAGSGNPDTTKNQRSNFIIGVAIGVTAASVSTIVVIVVVVVVMRKYYKRNSAQSPNVSDADSVYFRGNQASSVGSTSPTIQPTYSNPWDDPAFHMYEYICSDTLPHRKQMSSLKRGKPGEDGYLAPRSTGKRSWVESSGRSTTAHRNLLEPPVIERRINDDSNGDPHGRVSSFNELEVEAYGYPESDYTCRV